MTVAKPPKPKPPKPKPPKPKPPKPSFGSRVKDLRKTRSWSQEQLTRAMGIPGEHNSAIISRIEGKAGHIPKLDTITKLASVFGVAVNYLITGESK